MTLTEHNATVSVTFVIVHSSMWKPATKASAAAHMELLIECPKVTWESLWTSLFENYNNAFLGFENENND